MMSLKGNISFAQRDILQGVEAASTVREPLERPQSLPPLPEVVQTFMQGTSEKALKHIQSDGSASIAQIGSVAHDIRLLTGVEPSSERHPGSVHAFEGGEDHAWARLNNSIGNSTRHATSSKPQQSSLQRTCPSLNPDGRKASIVFILCVTAVYSQGILFEMYYCSEACGKKASEQPLAHIPSSLQRICALQMPTGAF